MSYEGKEYSLTELGEYNGEGTRDRILLSIAGNVFDVTDSGFYNASSRYHLFAGKDITVNMCVSSLEAATLNQLDLDPSITEQKLKDKVQFYKNKYTRVGWLKEWKDKHGDAAFLW